MQETMIMSILELLESKGLATYQEWMNIMEKKVMKNKKLILINYF